jgi:hypothetical protein
MNCVVTGRAQMSAGFATSYSFMFAGVTALIVHTIFYHGKVGFILNYIKNIQILSCWILRARGKM